MQSEFDLSLFAENNELSLIKIDLFDFFICGNFCIGPLYSYL